MSADSPRRGSKGSGTVVRPEAVSDKSVMASVVDFFQDVAYSHNVPKSDDREKICWVRFERADINDPVLYNELGSSGSVITPLLLIIGYSNGVQIWSLPASGEAQEVLSMRQGPIRILRVLPSPKDVFGRSDTFASKRPLLAICDASSAGQPYCCVKFVSLRTGDEVHNITFTHPVSDVKCNERLVVVAFSERIAAFDACQFRQRFTISSCYPAPGRNPNPVALGSRWLAYADKKLIPVHQSCGGMTGDGGQSYAATVISAAKTLTKGLTMFGETVASSLTGMKPPPQTPKKEPLDQNGWRPGVVTIVDIQRVGEGAISVQDDSEGEGLVAHFPAHASEPVTAMSFDPSGTLLLTVDRLGHNFHLFRILAHPLSCSLGAVHHLYTLHRGDTTAHIQDMAFSEDSRWVAVTTLRATTHVFPITPYGGAINVRTHTSPRVVNRASRFHRSAGLEDISHQRSAASAAKDSGSLSGSPGSSPGRDRALLLQQNALNSHNPRLPPFPHPTTVLPLVQVKQSMSIPGLGSSGGGGSSSKAGSQGQGGRAARELFCVAVCFAPSRGWVAGSSNLSNRSDERKAVDSLFVASWNGVLTEHVLEPRPKSSGQEKVTEDSAIEMTEAPRAQWTLGRLMTSTELRPPLTPSNPLLFDVHSKVTGDTLSGMGLRQESRESVSSDLSTKEGGEEQWLAQVEILTHPGPHRRLWMGPQFSFKTFQGSTTVLPSSSAVLLSQSPSDSAMDVVSDDLDLHSLRISPTRSSPVAMPGQKQRRTRGASFEGDPKPSPGPTYIEAGSYEQYPHVIEVASLGWPVDGSTPVGGGEVGEDLLREHLADAMHEIPSAKDPLGRTRDLDPDNLSTSSGSAGSTTRGGHSFDARSSPPHNIEHVLVFPGARGSPDLSN